MERAIFINTPSSDDPGKAIIQLEGNLDINQARFLKLKFDELLTNYKNIEILGTNIEYLDLSFIQLFQSFKNMAKKKRIELVYHFHLEDDIFILLERAGININA